VAARSRFFEGPSHRIVLFHAALVTHCSRDSSMGHGNWSRGSINRPTCSRKAKVVKADAGTALSVPGGGSFFERCRAECGSGWLIERKLTADLLFRSVDAMSGDGVCCWCWWSRGGGGCEGERERVVSRAEKMPGDKRNTTQFRCLSSFPSVS